jgi:hypothetical protein
VVVAISLDTAPVFEFEPLRADFGCGALEVVFEGFFLEFFVTRRFGAISMTLESVDYHISESFRNYPLRFLVIIANSDRKVTVDEKYGIR